MPGPLPLDPPISIGYDTVANPGDGDLGHLPLGKHFKKSCRGMQQSLCKFCSLPHPNHISTPAILAILWLCTFFNFSRCRCDHHKYVVNDKNKAKFFHEDYDGFNLRVEPFFNVLKGNPSGTNLDSKYRNDR